MANHSIPQDQTSLVGGHRVGFWLVAGAFTTAMAFTTVPTPLWSLYAQRDRFSSFTVTVVFAVYALAVALRPRRAGRSRRTQGAGSRASHRCLQL
jgi:hypothetical protein